MRAVTLKPGERVDDLLTGDLKIIQSDEVFRFSLDAVLLARFASVPSRGRILDLCSGNGIIPILLATRTPAPIDAVEIQERLCDMAERSVRLNGLENRIRILHEDLRSCHRVLGQGKYDLVTVNPPYLKACPDTSRNPHRALARHEIACTLKDVIAACSRLVKFGGRVAMVHRPARLAELMQLLRESRLEPKRLRFVHPRAGGEANMVLVEAVSGGGAELRVLPPLVVYDGNNEYCRELLDIYYGKAGELA